MTRSNYFGASLLVLLSLVVTAGAQTTQGDLTGTVRDASGAPVPAVKVTILNESNGATRVLDTDETGSYRAIGFFVGSYRVEFEKTGFKKKAVPAVRVEPATLRRVDAEMQVGDVTESVEVRGDAAPVVQTEGTTINFGLPRVALDRKLSDNTRSGWAMDVLMWSPGSAGGRNGLFLYGGNRGGVTEVSMEGAQQSISLFHAAHRARGTHRHQRERAGRVRARHQRQRNLQERHQPVARRLHIDASQPLPERCAYTFLPGRPRSLLPPVAAERRGGWSGVAAEGLQREEQNFLVFQLQPPAAHRRRREFRQDHSDGEDAPRRLLGVSAEATRSAERTAVSERGDSGQPDQRGGAERDEGLLQHV